jgi:hypothetical protein
MTKDQTAQAFILGKPGKCHNAITDGKKYTLHKSVIAERKDDGSIHCSFCGHFTITTAAHLNAILKASGAGFKVSMAKARAGEDREFIIKPGKV